MNDLHESEDIAAFNEESLQALVNKIELTEGFSLILVHCNYSSLRSRMVSRLREICSLEIRELVLEESVKTLYTTIQAALGDEQPDALMVFGLESVANIDKVLISANLVRDEFRRNFLFPVILWVNDEVLQKLIRLTPDLESFATTSEFAIATDELIHTINKSADDAFKTLLGAGAGRFLDNAVLNIAIDSRHRLELESALRDLQSRIQHLDPELEANLHFLLGRDAQASGQMQKARQYYEQSLAFWPQKNCIERYGALLFYLGLWWRRYAVLHRAEYLQGCCQARSYFQQCVKVFQQGNRPDLAAKFINALGEVLTRLEEWDELERVAKASVNLHQTYQDTSHLASSGYAYGLLAEIALKRLAWGEAKKYAELALQKNAEPDVVTHVLKPANKDWSWSWQQYQSLYLLLLAKSQQHLGQQQEALCNLEKAREDCNPQYDPLLYIRILKTLRSLYFNQGEYLKAFEIKQEQRSIEAQYGFRPFTGAGSLLPLKRVINPALETADINLKARERITATGQQQDISNLIERISRNDHKLIVIHGMSGVGKSSLLRAGLVPDLKQRAIGDRNVLPVLLRRVVYTNWVKELGRQLAEILAENEIRAQSNQEADFNSKLFDTQDLKIDSTDAIIEQLRRNVESNLLTVLIFDQFEEFFFICTNLCERQQFYEFLRVCLNLPYLKVILSLREDYLHYLLECDRYTNLDVINQNILDKNIRYYLGDFSPKRAKSVIRELTERSQFYLQPELIDQLVQDLAGEFGEIRPIELQVVGAQLQTDNITTLEEYHQLGDNPKEKLVQRSLEDVIKDCGAENERAARLILYLLTNENGTRPLKTRNELVADLELLGFESEVEQLDLVLEVLVGSGLVFMVPESPANRYQLVHDYLVAFIRQQQAPGLLKELAEAKERQKLTEAQLRQALREKEVALRQEQQERKRAEIAEIEALNSLSQALWLSHDWLGALVTSVKAGILLRETEVPSSIRLRVVDKIRQSVCEVRERNRLQGHSSWVASVNFSPDRKTIASASADTTVKLWSTDGTLLNTLQGHNGVVWDVSFSPDRKMIASASADTTVKLWSRNGTLLNTLQGHSDQVFSVSFSPNSQTVISASADKTIKIWSRQGALLKTLHGHNNQVLSASFSPDGTMIASASADKTVKLWSIDVQNWSKHGTLLKTLQGHSATVNSVSFSPDSQTIASASEDKTIKIWSRNGKLLKTLEGHSANVNSVSFSPDGMMFASASEDTSIKLWSKNGKLQRTLQGHSDGVNSVSFSFDSKTIASASADKTVKLWSRQGTKLQTSELDDLLEYGCEWLRDYLKTNPNVSESDNPCGMLR
jgi:tetratricopeptide (TPR) repeat protein